MYRWMIPVTLMMLLGALPATAFAQGDESSDEGEEAPPTKPAKKAADEAAEAVDEAAEAVDEAAEAVDEAAEAVDGAAADQAAGAVDEAAADQTAEAAEAVDAPAVEDASAEPESALADPKKFKVSLVAEAGVVWLAGNTQSITANGGMAFGLANARHAFGLKLGGNYGRSVIKEEIDENGDGTIDVVNDKWATTATRIFGDVRYDLSLIPTVNSIYAGVGAFHDPFGGYVYRMRGDVGYSHHIVNTPVHSVRGEAGFNYTRELYVDDATITTDDEVSFRTQNFVGARLFAGYKLTPSEAFGFFLNVEALLGGTDNADARFDGRLGASTGIMANLSKVFSIKLGFAMDYDFVPPDLDGIPGPDVKALDTTTTATLVATLF